MHDTCDEEEENCEFYFEYLNFVNLVSYITWDKTSIYGFENELILFNETSLYLRF